MTEEVPTLALSILQPWAYAILALGKNVENRTWFNGWTGRIVIHAGQGYDEEGEERLRAKGYSIPADLPRGAFVGEVTITGCRRCTVAERFGTGGNSWACGPWCFTLEDAVAYREPVPGRGRLKFFPVPPEVLARRGRLLEAREPAPACSICGEECDFVPCPDCAERGSRGCALCEWAGGWWVCPDWECEGSEREE